MGDDIKIWAISETLWYAGESLEDCLRAFANDIEANPDSYTISVDSRFPYEENKKRLNELYFSFSGNSRLVSFAERLEFFKRANQKFPKLFLNKEKVTVWVDCKESSNSEPEEIFM